MPLPDGLLTGVLIGMALMAFVDRTFFPWLAHEVVQHRRLSRRD